MGAALEYATQLSLLSCGECGIEFAVPGGWLEVRRNGTETTRQFYCPNGHVRVFRETELDRVKRELEQERAKVQRAHDAREAAESRARGAEISAGKVRAQLRRVRQRVGGGTCPCCKRNFSQLRRHMEHKHPDYRHVEVGA